MVRRSIRVLAGAVVLGIVAPPLWFAVFPVTPAALPEPGRRIPVGEGVSVNAIEKGEGLPVVLVHGLPGCAYDWAPLTDALASRGHRVLAYDRVGFGHSDARRDGDYTLGANGRELVRLLVSEDLRDATLVGWSYGGGTAIEAVLHDPERIGRLVLVGSAGPLDDPPEPSPVFGVLFSAPVLAWIAAVPPVATGLQGALSAEAFSGQPQPAWWAPQLGANMAAPHTRDTWRAEGEHFRWESDPSRVERPVLVVHGDDDRLAPLAVGEALARLAPRSELVVVKGGSHMLPITHAGALAERIAAFVRGGG